MDNGFINTDEIKELLPHREPMLLVEEACLEKDDEGNRIAKGRYSIKGDEWFLQGHFPGNPVVPGVILCEMMAQTCCVLIGDTPEFNGVSITPYFTGLDKVKFRRPVKPGEVFESECKIVRRKSNFFFAEGVGKVGDELAVKAAFSFAIIVNK